MEGKGSAHRPSGDLLSAGWLRAASQSTLESCQGRPRPRGVQVVGTLWGWSMICGVSGSVNNLLKCSNVSSLARVRVAITAALCVYE